MPKELNNAPQTILVLGTTHLDNTHNGDMYNVKHDDISDQNRREKLKNVVELINSNKERIFVLYGAEHLHLLTQFLNESGIFNIKNISDYL